MISPQICSACGAEISVDHTCETDFHQFMFWEQEFPEVYIVHHLMVLGYYLQHPHLYSPQGLDGAKHQLEEFIEMDISPEAMRQKIRKSVDSGKRDFPITAREGQLGKWEHPFTWTMRACDVVAGGAENYIENIRKWARSIYDDLKASGNL